MSVVPCEAEQNLPLLVDIFVVYRKNEYTSLSSSLGKRTENWDKNNNLNTYLDLSPLVPCLPPSSVNMSLL